MMAYHDVDVNQKISLDDLIDECKTFYVIGQKTTASVLSWIVLLLVTECDLQNKARKEVKELFGQYSPNTYIISLLNIASKPYINNNDQILTILSYI